MPRGVKGSGPAPKRVEHQWLTFEEGNPEWVALLLKHCARCGTPWVEKPAPTGWQMIDWEAKHRDGTCTPSDA